MEITENQWTKAQNRVHSSSVCIRHGLLQFKILHRLHLSKLKLSKMFPTVNPLCDRCGQAPASLAHMFWTCPSITTYWVKIFQSLSEILQENIKPDPVLALFGVGSAAMELILSNNQKNVICFVTLLARRIILLNWKQKNPPAFQTLMNDIMKHLQLEKM